MPEALIHSDGSCDKQGVGGYGVVIEDDEGTRELAKGFQNSTVNRMELRAAIAGLSAVKPGTKVRLVSDSKYVVNGINVYVKRWVANGWRAPIWEKVEGTDQFVASLETKEVANRDLWEELAELIETRPTIAQWVKGHKGHNGNERADTLAGNARKYGSKQECRPRPQEKPKEIPEF